MPWTLARDFSTACERLRRERLLDAAIAARMAQADEKGWKQAMKEMRREA